MPPSLFQRLRQLLRLPTPGVLLRLLLIAAIGVLVGRFWHPYYGFTNFLQCDADMASRMIPALRPAPVFIQPGPGGYDGFAYAQIATDPSARSPDLKPATDDLGYRARRILLSAVAWTAGGGDPVRAVRTYAWLNLFAWLGLAALVWTVLPAAGWRENLGWIGVLFAFGSLLSVRLALTDLPGMLLLGTALVALERGRIRLALVAFALATLTRETLLLGLVALLPPVRADARTWGRALGRLTLAALPLALWVGYLLLTVGTSGAGRLNFGLPGVALVQKFIDVSQIVLAGQFPELSIPTLLALIALVLQGVYLLTHLRPDDPWWRVGIAHVGLMLCLGPAVWGEDLPGASVRVLLPLTLAFNVLAVRARASGWWLVPGNLAVLGGALALWLVPYHPREFTTGYLRGSGGYVCDLGPGWYGVETNGQNRWSWCAQDAELRLRPWPSDRPQTRIILWLLAYTPGDVEIRRGDRLLWHGSVDDRQHTRVDFTLPGPEATDLTLTLHSRTPPHRESPNSDARSLGFALYGVRIR